jgi:hypothetical protein
MKINNVFDLLCFQYQLEGAEKVTAYKHFREGGISAVIAYLSENGNQSFAEDERKHAIAIGQERQVVYTLLGKESARISAFNIKSRLFLGKRTKEGD